MSRTRVVWTARCLVCDWTDTTPGYDLAARKHGGEGPYSKKPGPKHPTVCEGVAT